MQFILTGEDQAFSNRPRPVARLFCGGGQIGQILEPFMITHGLSCDRVGFGHFLFYFIYLFIYLFFFGGGGWGGGGGEEGSNDPLIPTWLRA